MTQGGPLRRARQPPDSQRSRASQHHIKPGQRPHCPPERLSAHAPRPRPRRPRRPSKIALVARKQASRVDTGAPVRLSRPQWSALRHPRARHTRIKARRRSRSRSRTSSRPRSQSVTSSNHHAVSRPRQRLNAHPSGVWSTSYCSQSSALQDAPPLEFVPPASYFAEEP